MPLAKMSLLQPATIVSLPADYQLLRRLVSYGLLPGVEVMVERRVPAFIVAIGASRIALDRQTAAAILVQTTNP
ncbi:MAG: ferrous iron transport protein A [Firmicutes bacterium]|nr:ferrous iron transport protein A [Bacillota bacterium]